jgi:hypothetical protein
MREIFVVMLLRSATPLYMHSRGIQCVSNGPERNHRQLAVPHIPAVEATCECVCCPNAIVGTESAKYRRRQLFRLRDRSRRSS